MPAVPDVVPILSRGKHRNPRRGACFMELASYLAGERWSDTPSCTHPLLGEIARNVNDRTSDDARPLLAPLIPDVIGLRGDDPRLHVRLALHCALVALPVAPAERQRALAVAVTSAARLRAALHDLPDDVGVRVDRALAGAPVAAAWAERFTARAGGTTSVRRFVRNGSHDVVRLAARGVEQAEGVDRDAVLRTMLEGAIAEARALQPTRPPFDADRWRAACALTV